MLQQSLRHRICDTLKRFAPFNDFKIDDLLDLSQKVVIEYCAEGDFIFKQDETPKKYFFFIKEGSIKLFKTTDENTVLHNQCDEGDCIGVRQLFIEDPYWFNAQATEETLLYAIPLDAMKPLLQTYPKATFFFAQTFSINLRNNLEQSATASEIQPEANLSAIFSLEKVRNAVTCSPEISVKEAAFLMNRTRISSLVVVDEYENPCGVVSDSTLRRLVATGIFGIDTPVEKIMTRPPACTKAGLTLADIQIQMIQKKVRYLCVTEDGTPKTKLQGIVTEHDLIIAHGNNPAVLLREIQNTNDVDELKKIMQRVDSLLENYLNMDVSTHFTANLIAELNDTFTRKSIEIAQQELKNQGIVAPQGVGFCWLTLGSGGRREQLLKTDQDNALIFSNVAPEQLEETKTYFLQLSKRVTDILHHGGFEYCIGEMMASNPSWCLSLDAWKQLFTDWMNQPNAESLLKYKIFFDYRPVFGDELLAEQLTESIFAHIKKNGIFLTFMAKDAIENPPPLSFFRNLIVEKNGEHKDEFNVKARGLTPIADLVRVLVLGAGITKQSNTIQRLEALAELEPHHKTLYANVMKSYETILKFRAKQGLKNKNSGKYIKPADLDKLDRLLLRQSFRPIEDLQSVVSIRFATIQLH
jgi:CBS domain-containing protein